MRNATPSLLFDLDGTLVDTDELHFGAYQRLLAQFDRSISLQTYKTKIMGASNDTIMRELFPELPQSRHVELSERKEQLFRAAVTRLEPTAGVLTVLDWAEARDVGVAVVTNAPRANAELMLRGMGLLDRIGVLVIGAELARGKPDPLPYKVGLARLGTAPDRAIAFEDSLSGVRAASAAGIYTFGVTTSLSAEALLEAGAHGVIGDFTAPALWQRLATISASHFPAQPTT